MSKYDKASLVMIPSAYKAEKLYSVLPENGNGDFTHDRSAGTATRVNKDGLIETVAADVPRLDYPLIDGVVQDCPALLLEPVRTNVSQYTEQQSSWSKARVTVSDNQAVSPDGTQNASKVTTTSDTGTHPVYRNMAGIVTSGSTYVSSIFVKKSTAKYIRFSEGYSNYNLIFNFDTEEITTTGNSTVDDLKVEKYPNNWYRLIIKFVADSSGNAQSGVYVRDDDNNDTYAGSGESIFLWGSQIELGDYATSYIRNLSTGSTTRNADVCDNAGTSAEFNDSEGVLFAECAFINDKGTSIPFQIQRISVSDGTDTNRIFISNTTTSNQIQVFVRNSTGISFNKTVSLDITQQNKISIKYKANDYALWINGFELETDTTYDYLPSGLDELQFAGATAYPFLGKTKELAVFKEALTDSELEALTSWDSFNDMATSQLYTIR